MGRLRQEASGALYSTMGETMMRLNRWGRGPWTALGMLIAAVAPGTAHAAPTHDDPQDAFRLLLRQARARFDGKVLRVRLGWQGRPRAGTITLRLLDLKDRPLATTSRTLGPGQKGPWEAKLAVDRRHHKGLDLLRLAAVFRPQGRPPKTQRAVVALSEVGDMPFVWLRGQNQLTAGSRAALRITVRDLRKRPLPGAKVLLKLTARARTLTVRGVADALGSLQLGFTVPQRWAGLKVRLVVSAQTAAFSRTVRSRIHIRRTVGVLLTTDKPIYQPGQTVHLRLLALRQPSRKPLASAKVRFSVSDARGNRLLAQSLTTDKFGSAWTRVSLSRHAAIGKLTLRARVQTDARHHQTATTQVKIFRYRVPPFRVKLLTDQGHYRPGARLRATVEARYLQGKPVPGARVRVTLQLIRTARACRSPGSYCRHYHQGSLLFATVKGRTDHRGRLRLRATIPRNIAPRILLLGGARVRLSATVTEPGGHQRDKVRNVPVSRHGVILTAVAEAGDLVPGVSQRVFVIAAHPDGTPAPGKVQVDYWEVDKKRRRSTLRRVRLRTDDQGVAVVSVKPSEGKLRLSLSATDRRGYKGYRSITLDCSGTVLVQPQRAVWRGGELLRVAVKTNGLTGRVYLDVKHRDQTVQTAAASLLGGRAFVTVRLPDDVDGLVTIVARVGGLLQGWRTGWAPALVQPKRRLTLRIRAHRKQYRPGDRARLDLQVTDEQGRGQRAALGLTIVDEGVYVLAGKTPGGEENRFLIEHAARKISTGHAGWTLQRLLHAPRSKQRSTLASAVLARLRDGGFSAASDSLVRRGHLDFNAYRRRIKRLVASKLKGWFRVRFRTLAAMQRLQWIYHHRLHPLCGSQRPDLLSLGKLARKGRLTRGTITDPWGTLITWSERGSGKSSKHFWVELQSAGPDATWNTVDDLKAGPFKLRMPKLRRLSGCGFGLGGRGYGVGSYRSRRPRVFSSRASVSGGLDASGMPSWASDRAEPRVRRNFKETLAVLPALRTDAQGHATVKLRLADNITTWVVHAIASGLSGRVGSRVARVRAFRPFYVDTRLPVQLTRGDDVEVPVVVHNYLSRPSTVRLQIRGSDTIQPVRRPGLQLQLVPGPAGPRLRRTLKTAPQRDHILIVPAQGVASTRIRIRAVRVGRGSITVVARAAGVADAVERSTQVVPEGWLQADGASGILQGPVTHTVTLPQGFVPDSQHLSLTLEPSLLAASAGSLDSLLRRPHGCMEQSSAVTYPNILVLRHLRRRPIKHPRQRRALARAHRLVNEGYQRLLSFEVSGGGFSLYGGSPADVSLSALGLAQLIDMAAVRYVDPAVITRTRKHLLRQQTTSGSWKPEGYVDLGGGDGLARRMVVTAYVAWLLGRTVDRSGGRADFRDRPTQRAVRRAVDFLSTHLFLIRENPYALALAANAATASGTRRHLTFARQVRRLLAALARRSATTHWRPRPGHRTVFGGNGRGAAQETTALALLALHKQPGTSALVSGATRFLLAERQPEGAWTTTRATVLSLLALLRVTSARARPHRKVRVFLNGRLRGVLSPGAGGATTATLDLSDRLTAGTHRLRLVPVGPGSGLYRLGLRYHSRRPIRRSTGQPRIRVRYSRQRLSLSQSVTVHVRLDNPTSAPLLAPMVELGLPPGFALDDSSFRRRAAGAGVASFGRRPGMMLLYFTSLPKGTTRFSFRLRPRQALRVRIPRSRLYEYYEPERQSVTAPAFIEVRRASPRLVSLADLLR